MRRLLATGSCGRIARSSCCSNRVLPLIWTSYWDLRSMLRPTVRICRHADKDLELDSGHRCPCPDCKRYDPISPYRRHTKHISQRLRPTRSRASRSNRRDIHRHGDDRGTQPAVQDARASRPDVSKNAMSQVAPLRILPELLPFRRVVPITEDDRSPIT